MMWLLVWPCRRLVPQGMAHAGLPAVTGLYTSILCLTGYAVFALQSAGPGLGPDSSLGPMIPATILPLAGADGDPARADNVVELMKIMPGWGLQ